MVAKHGCASNGKEKMMTKAWGVGVWVGVLGGVGVGAVAV